METFDLLIMLGYDQFSWIEKPRVLVLHHILVVDDVNVLEPGLVVFISVLALRVVRIALLHLVSRLNNILF
jgi:hypothetical protein